MKLIKRFKPLKKPANYISLKIKMVAMKTLEFKNTLPLFILSPLNSFLLLFSLKLDLDIGINPNEKPSSDLLCFR